MIIDIPYSAVDTDTSIPNEVKTSPSVNRNNINEPDKEQEGMYLV